MNNDRKWASNEKDQLLVENFKKFRMQLIESASYEESLETLYKINKNFKESKILA